jgi:hypothetical protein
MKLLTTLMMMAVLVMAADEKTDTLAAKVKALEQDARFAKLKETVMQEQLVTTELTKIQAEKQAAYVEACKGAGLEPDPKVCGVDWQGRKMFKIEAEKK